MEAVEEVEEGDSPWTQWRRAEEAEEEVMPVEEVDSPMGTDSSSDGDDHGEEIFQQEMGRGKKK